MVFYDFSINAHEYICTVIFFLIPVMFSQAYASIINFFKILMYFLHIC